MITVNEGSITKKGAGRNFWAFLKRSCIDLIALNICKIYEYEKAYELNSVEGVLKHIIDKRSSVLNSSHIDNFIHKYDGQNNGEPLSALSSTVAGFKKKYQHELERFKTYRNKRVAHSESGFNPNGLPSYDVMEHLFDFGSDFYKLVSAAFVSTTSVSIVPCDFNSNRKVKTGLIKILSEYCLADIKTKWNE